MAGYSGKPLAAKLGIKPGAEIHVVNPPEGYLALVEPLPEGVTFAEHLTDHTEFVHLFSTSKSKLAGSLVAFRKQIKPTAAVWVSWPKKSAKMPTDITEDTVREVALPLGFVDIKVCAVSEIWSGLKLVIRKEMR